MARTKGSITTIDFISIDGVPDDSGNASAVLSARVAMTNEALVALHNMLDSHIKAWGGTQNDA